MSQRQRPRSTRIKASATTAQRPDALTVWSLRILARFVPPSRLAATLDSIDDEVVVQLGLIGRSQEKNLASLRRRLRATLSRHDRQPIRITRPLGTNIAWLGDTLNLTAGERRVLAFVVLAQTAPPLRTVIDAAGELFDNEAAIRIIAAALAERLEVVRKTLSTGGTLARAGLLRIQWRIACSFGLKLDLLEGLRDVLLQPQRDFSEMLSGFFGTATPPTLTPEDYPHAADSIALLSDYLRAALARRSAGVNVLVYGQPGTGKTELARVIAQAVSGTLYEVKATNENEDGTESGGENRFGAYGLCQSMLVRKSDCLILFDEIEDVFIGDAVLSGDHDRCKAWVNRMMETNLVPTIWISNSVDAIEPAHLRRFDYVLKLGVPPRRVRQRILEKHFTNLAVRPAFIESLAAHPGLAPAQVERAARVVAQLNHQGPELVETALTNVLGGTLEALGQPARAPSTPASPSAYDLTLLNADRDPVAIVKGLSRHPHARLCLYGPPGTGKTAFAHHLARALDRPLLLKRASDLLAAFVGETEQRIAEMFHEAETERAVLLLDEADSMLQTRAAAHQSWEITQVNEILVQMEAFEGIFIAATNLPDTLDEASLRRFDLKVRFDYLNSDQARVAFERVLAKHSASASVTENILRRTAALDTLTPGDFATVTRQAKALGETLDARWLIEGLEAECMTKGARIRMPVGFRAEV